MPLTEGPSAAHRTTPDGGIDENVPCSHPNNIRILPDKPPGNLEPSGTKEIRLKNSTRWLRISYWVGAIADGAVAAMMLSQTFLGRPSPLMSYLPEVPYRYAMGLAGDPEDVTVLGDRSRAPHHKRQWEVTVEEEARILKLRRDNIHYGKQKLKVLYEKLCGENISTWKIERVIRKHKLYPDKRKAEKVMAERDSQGKQADIAVEIGRKHDYIFFKCLSWP